MDRLFSRARLYDVLEEAKSRLRREVETLDQNRLLNTPPNDLMQSLVEKYTLRTPELREDGIHYQMDETEVDARNFRDQFFMRDMSRPQMIPGTRFTFTVPFEGDKELFDYEPNTFGPQKPRATVAAGCLTFQIDAAQPDGQQIQAQIDRDLATVKGWLRDIDSMVKHLNSELPGIAQRWIEERRQRLLHSMKTASSIRFPLKQRGGAPVTFAPANIQRRPRVEVPPTQTDAFRPEPALATEDYEHILDVMQNMAVVLERSPKAFVGMDEETLRVMFLVQLNGHFEGQATGETFNFEGKTDILIKNEGRNIFIAECKFWSGPEKFVETVDQLLGYLTWRDSKAALVIFNRNKDFSAVVEKIKATLKGHPNFKREVAAPGRPGYRVVTRHRDDANREILVTALAFDVPI